MDIIYDKFGLRINGKVYYLTNFFQTPNFKNKIMTLIRSSIKKIVNDHLILKNNSLIESFEIRSNDQIKSTLFILDTIFSAKFGIITQDNEIVKSQKPRINFFIELGLIINNKRYYISDFVANSETFKEELYSLLGISIKSINDKYLTLINGITIDRAYENLFDLIMTKTCHGSLAFCCGIIKECPYRDYVRRILVITDEEYVRIKLGSEESFKDLVFSRNPSFLTDKDIYDLSLKDVCYHSLAYCCSLKKGCQNRDGVRSILGISEGDYNKMKLKQENGFRKLVFSKNPSFFTNNIKYLKSF